MLEPKSSKLAFLCDWLPPDFGAVGQYTLLRARDLAAEGNEVVLGGLSSTDDRVEREEHGAGSLTIYRIQANEYDKQRLIARLVWTVKANTRMLTRLYTALRDVDEIQFTGSPPFMLHFVWLANLLLKRRLVYRITDFHPECLMASMERAPFPLWLFQRLTVALRRRIHRFEALGEDQRKRLRECGIPDSRIVVRRDPSPVAIESDTCPLERPKELTGLCVLLYSGNWGAAHDHETFCEGYRRHHIHGSGRVGLWLNATGYRADLVEQSVRADGLPVARGHLVPLEVLPDLMVTPDCHLITLDDGFWGYALPSKVYSCIESGRPIMFVGPEASDVHLLCHQKPMCDRYLKCEVGDPNSVAEALEKVADVASARSFADWSDASELEGTT